MRNKPSLTSADVKKMLAACEAKEAIKNKWYSGRSRSSTTARILLGFQRMDGCCPSAPKCRSGRPPLRR